MLWGRTISAKGGPVRPVVAAFATLLALVAGTVPAQPAGATVVTPTVVGGPVGQPRLSPQDLTGQLPAMGDGSVLGRPLSAGGGVR